MWQRKAEPRRSEERKGFQQVKEEHNAGTQKVRDWMSYKSTNNAEVI